MQIHVILPCKWTEKKRRKKSICATNQVNLGVNQESQPVSHIYVFHFDNVNLTFFPGYESIARSEQPSTTEKYSFWLAGSWPKLLKKAHPSQLIQAHKLSVRQSSNTHLMITWESYFTSYLLFHPFDTLNTHSMMVNAFPPNIISLIKDLKIIGFQAHDIIITHCS